MFKKDIDRHVIPKKIWQTYKDPYDSLPGYIKDTAVTWKQHNPDYQYEYMDDEQAAAFVKDFYGKKIYDIYMGFPLGVMRGDFWRYLIIYAYGGIYADLDTICKRPVDSWLKQDYKMIVCPEHDLHFCQWTFAATKKNPIIKSVIDLIVERNKNPDYTMPHFVHYYTGPAVWTSGIYNGLGINEPDHTCEGMPSDGRCVHRDLIQRVPSINDLPEVKEKRFYCYSGNDWQIFHLDAVHHLYGSQRWNEGYVKWIDQPLAKESR